MTTATGWRRLAAVTAASAGLMLAAGAPADAAPTPVQAPVSPSLQAPPGPPHSRVSLTVPRTVPPGASVTLTGTVHPAHPGRRVQLQALTAGRWHRLASVRLSRRSTYTFHRTLPVAGAALTLRVVLPAHRDHRVGVSRPRVVRAVPPGFDVSYPQCGTALPVGAAFGVVGVDGGKPFAANACLAQQIAWALPSGAPAYYVNTANPGPRRSSFWPSGQPTPQACAATYPANDSTACAFDYGWNATAVSYARAAAAAASVGAPAVATATWWLDVETGNTWESQLYGESARYLRADLAVLRGAAAFLHAQGVRTVGVYSTAHQWARVTGSARWAAAPVWYAGVGSPTAALTRCAQSFTGGRVRMAQYAAAGFDANHRC